ncbi:MAG TPA: efflux RND transporter periplasmic adaptor subunit [Verrucomicrobiae bacterium]|jgi:cobalt-zinc-cadmium efflux system membrane fusion protein|nr:efflux RND transporter periplasmic adaptor subunit [Verrucomicrobiae bacterium]
MKTRGLGVLTLSLTLGLLGAGCSKKSDPQAEAPPPVKVVSVADRNLFQVDRPERFPLTQATAHDSTSELKVTGVIAPDISRNVPVISLASGRIVQVDARLGDTVKKGQVLLKVQSADISGAFSDYRKAVADEQLAHTQLERSKQLYDRGAISLNDLQVAQDTEDKAKVDVETTAEKLRVLGNASLDHPSGIVDIRAPISGVITDQQVTNASGVQGLASPNPFTISDLSDVWILCDVYENDLGTVRVGEKANIRLNSYPEQDFTGTISNIGPILDPNLRTAKVRIEVHNPGLMRPGMFVTATFHGQQKEKRAAVPATAILHLHDREWVYIPKDNEFRRVEVVSGDMLPGGMQEIVKGIEPGQQVVANALEFQNTVEQ